MPTIFDDPLNPAYSTGQQIIEWQLSIMDSVNSIQALMITLNAMPALMASNTVDFTPDDVEAMEEILIYLENHVSNIC